MKTSSKREQSRIRQRRQKWINFGIIGGAALIILGILGVVIWQGVKPQTGEAVAVPADYVTHVEIGTPLTYPSDPPAGGRHYAEEFEKGFFDDSTLPQKPGDIEGYLVHNLEHGYVIFWYNCAKLDETACNDLKTQIKTVMNAKNNFKLIAVPRESINVPLVLTSWGRLQRFEQFDAGLANAFIDSNLNRAPEPDAQ